MNLNFTAMENTIKELEDLANDIEVSPEPAETKLQEKKEDLNLSPNGLDSSLPSTTMQSTLN